MEENQEQEPVTETGKIETDSAAAEEKTESPEDTEKTDEQEVAQEEGTEQPNEQTEVPKEEQQPVTEAVEPDPIDPEPEVDYQIYTLKSGNLVVKYEMNLGDILTCTLLAALILILLVNFFHRLILGGRPK